MNALLPRLRDLQPGLQPFVNLPLDAVLARQPRQIFFRLSVVVFGIDKTLLTLLIRAACFFSLSAHFAFQFFHLAPRQFVFVLPTFILSLDLQKRRAVAALAHVDVRREQKDSAVT